MKPEAIQSATAKASELFEICEALKIRRSWRFWQRPEIDPKNLAEVLGSLDHVRTVLNISTP